MLDERIVATLRFFDLQGTPVTLFELHKFLLADVGQLQPRLNDRFEYVSHNTYESPSSFGDVAAELATLTESGQVHMLQGYYCLPHRQSIIWDRLHNYEFGMLREQRIRRFAKFLRFIPFVRGAAVGGSQALGQETAGSDIDMFIITDSKFLWLARTLVTAYFQMFGVRRHGSKVANRFCLNHYVAGPHEVTDERDPYNALEYVRLRAIVGAAEINKFKRTNLKWIKNFYPNATTFDVAAQPQSVAQRLGEWLMRNRFGQWRERKLAAWQMPRIKRGEHAVATNSELSFHSKPRKYTLLRKFFGQSINSFEIPEMETE